MSSGRSRPPALAIWLLQYLCPNNNKEALTGDLLERFREGRSDGWFWRQVLIAILVGVSRELRLHWLSICYAVAGTVVLGFVGKASKPVMVQLWVWSRGTQWPPLSSAIYVLGQAAVLALVVLPILAALLLVSRAFGWVSILRTFGIGFLLIAIGHLVTFLWLSSHPVSTHQQELMLKAFGISRIFFTLLISAWLGCRLSPGSSNSGLASE